MAWSRRKEPSLTLHVRLHITDLAELVLLLENDSDLRVPDRMNAVAKRVLTGVIDKSGRRFGPSAAVKYLETKFGSGERPKEFESIKRSLDNG